MWLVCVALGVGGMAALIWVIEGLPSTAGRQARDGLRDSSVYVHPTAAGLLDVDAARRQIGDRPIVVAVRPGGTSGSASRACDDIVAEYPDVVAFVYDRWDRWESCAGTSFPEPADGSIRRWLSDLADEAEAASLFGPPPGGGREPVSDADLGPFVAELVVAFDLKVGDLSTAPGRRATSDVGDWLSVSLLVAPAAAGAVGAFVAVRQATRAAARRRRRRHEMAGSLAEVRATAYRLSARLTDALPRDPTATEAVATAAQDYAYAVALLERATTPADLTRVRERLAFTDEALQEVR